MKNYERVYAEIHLDRLHDNVKEIQKKLKMGTGLIGVVKADGYGHGAIPVAKTIAQFVTGYAVATADEAVELRAHGIEKGILILGPVLSCRYEEMIRNDISMSVFQYEKAAAISQTASGMGKTARIHIAVDTGMSRIGYRVSEESADEIVKISKLPGIRIEGMFTHFARADETDKASANKQMNSFKEFCSLVKSKGVEIPMCHCSNSAGIIDMSDANMDVARAGIILYGLYPSDEVNKEALPLKPVMEVRSVVTYIKEIPAGTAVSYGGTFVAEKPMKIATVSVGYADGYPRNLSSKGRVLIEGKSAPILGRVCMDQMMVDVSEIPEAHEESVVTLIGQDGDEMISMEEVAESCGGFHYEIPCVLGKRVPRIYKYGDKVLGSKDGFSDHYYVNE